MKGRFTGIALAAMLGGAAAADDYSLTVYSSAEPGAIAPERYRPVPGRPMPDMGGDLPGYAMVRQDRTMELDQGRSQVRFTDVAALIDPTTVTFRSLTDPEGTHVIEQGFRFDLVGADKLLERYIGREITVEQFHGESAERTRGELLGTSGGLILRQQDGSVSTMRDYDNVRFPELPGGLITRPTLEWDVSAEQGGEHETRVAYQTGGMTWWADYNATYSEADGCSLDVTAWVSLINQSGASYPGAKLKLVAGDVHRAEQPGRPRLHEMAVRTAEADTAGFEEKAFFEYHLYTLGRPTDLPDNATKQLELFEPALGVTCRKELVYEASGRIGGYGRPATDPGYGQTGNTDVNVFLRFNNSEDAGLGVPLPAGRVRVNQIDSADDSLEFIGEDTIDHTPKNEEVLIRMGNAFDVVGERKQTDFRVDSAAKEMEESFEIAIRNHKEVAAEIIVREHLYRWSNWEITQANADWEKQDSRTVHFPVEVPPGGEQIVRYTVRYTW
jgi:hypothetical protein